MVNTRNDCNG
jgi:hypothetical protein